MRAGRVLRARPLGRGGGAAASAARSAAASAAAAAASPSHARARRARRELLLRATPAAAAVAAWARRALARRPSLLGSPASIAHALRAGRRGYARQRRARGGGRGRGRPGALVLAVRGSVAGLLLLSAPPPDVLLGRQRDSPRALRPGVVRVAATVRSVPVSESRSCRGPPQRTPTSAVPPLDVEQRFPDVFERDGRDPDAASRAARRSRCRVMPLLPPPFSPGRAGRRADGGARSSAAYDDLPAGQESDAHELPVPLPVSNYRLPDPRRAPARHAPGGKDVDVERVGASLLAALTEHGVECRLIGTVSGPRVTRYELQLAPGTKVSRVSALRDDLAYALATTEIRILARSPASRRSASRCQPLAQPRLARRSRRRARDRLAAHRLARQGHLRPHRRRRPRAHAAHADRRHDRLGQVGLHQLDALLDPAAGDAGGGADDPDRPEEGRAQPLRDDPAPAHAGRHEHEERRLGAPERRARDGVALRADGASTRRATCPR